MSRKKIQGIVRIQNVIIWQIIYTEMKNLQWNVNRFYGGGLKNKDYYYIVNKYCMYYHFNMYLM